MFPPHTWQFTARAVEPTRAIFFAGPVLREYCERDPSLGYELLKRLTAVMNRRMQNARRKMLDVHWGKASLEPVVWQPPFMDQEFDTYPENAANETRKEARLQLAKAPGAEDDAANGEGEKGPAHIDQNERPRIGFES
jgi:CRP-like cAMP-binding protein